MTASQRIVILIVICLFGTFFFYLAISNRYHQSNEYCAGRISDMEIKGIFLSEMMERGYIPEGINLYAQKNGVGDVKWEIFLNPEFVPTNPTDEYSASRYVVQFSGANLNLWALLSSCGLVNMAGDGKFFQ